MFHFFQCSTMYDLNSTCRKLSILTVNPQRWVNIVSDRTASCPSGTGLRDVVQQVWNCANSSGKDEVAERWSWSSQGAPRDSERCVNTCRGSGWRWCSRGGLGVRSRGVSVSPPEWGQSGFCYRSQIPPARLHECKETWSGGFSVSVFRGWDSEDGGAPSLTRHLKITTKLFKCVSSFSGEFWKL